jgi:hypothetical protein
MCQLSRWRGLRTDRLFPWFSASLWYRITHTKLLKNPGVQADPYPPEILFPQSWRGAQAVWIYKLPGWLVLTRWRTTCSPPSSWYSWKTIKPRKQQLLVRADIGTALTRNWVSFWALARHTLTHLLPITISIIPILQKRNLKPKDTELLSDKVRLFPESCISMMHQYDVSMSEQAWPVSSRSAYCLCIFFPLF